MTFLSYHPSLPQPQTKRGGGKTSWPSLQVVFSFACWKRSKETTSSTPLSQSDAFIGRLTLCGRRGPGVQAFFSGSYYIRQTTWQKGGAVDRLSLGGMSALLLVSPRTDRSYPLHLSYNLRSNARVFDSFSTEKCTWKDPGDIISEIWVVVFGDYWKYCG